MAALFLILVMLINVAVNFAAPNPPYCWEFDEAQFDGWIGTGFTSSLTELPYTFGIPYWVSPPNFAYVQSSMPDTGTTGQLTMPFTINDGDVISANLYRHIITYNGTDRISVSFVTNGLTTAVLMNPDYDHWDIVELTCGTDHTSCCTVYPCDGVLQINGDVVTSDELVGVDYVGINSICGRVTPPPPPPTLPTIPTIPTIIPPLPGIYDCDFDKSLCDWNLATTSEGWHWSLYDGDPDPVKHPFFPARSSPYIWVEDTSAEVSSPIIEEVSKSTEFSFDYYFETSAELTDSFDVVFVDEREGPQPPFKIIYSDSGAWTKGSFQSDDICSEPLKTHCSGTIRITTTNVPFNNLLLAIDNFKVKI